MISNHDSTHESFEQSRLNIFNATIKGMTLIESMGGLYFWSNKLGPQHIKSKLDRAIDSSAKIYSQVV